MVTNQQVLNSLSSIPTVQPTVQPTSSASNTSNKPKLENSPPTSNISNEMVANSLANIQAIPPGQSVPSTTSTSPVQQQQNQYALSVGKIGLTNDQLGVAREALESVTSKLARDKLKSLHNSGASNSLLYKPIISMLERTVSSSDKKINAQLAHAAATGEAKDKRVLKMLELLVQNTKDLKKKDSSAVALTAKTAREEINKTEKERGSYNPNDYMTLEGQLAWMGMKKVWGAGKRVWKSATEGNDNQNAQISGMSPIAEVAAGLMQQPQDVSVPDNKSNYNQEQYTLKNAVDDLLLGIKGIFSEYFRVQNEKNYDRDSSSGVSFANLSNRSNVSQVPTSDSSSAGGAFGTIVAGLMSGAGKLGSIFTDLVGSFGKLLTSVGGLLGTATKMASVVGAGYAGYQAGKWMNENVIQPGMEKLTGVEGESLGTAIYSGIDKLQDLGLAPGDSDSAKSSKAEVKAYVASKDDKVKEIIKVLSPNLATDKNALNAYKTLTSIQNDMSINENEKKAKIDEMYNIYVKGENKKIAEVKAVPAEKKSIAKLFGTNSILEKSDSYVEGDAAKYFGEVESVKSLANKMNSIQEVESKVTQLVDEKEAAKHQAVINAPQNVTNNNVNNVSSNDSARIYPRQTESSFVRLSDSRMNLGWTG